MGISDTAKNVVEKVNSPWVNLAVIITMATSMTAGAKWGLAKVEDAEKKADSAEKTAVRMEERQKGMDEKINLLVQMQMMNMKPGAVIPKRDTVVTFFRVARGDTTLTYWRNGTLSDTMYVPLRDTL